MNWHRVKCVDPIATCLFIKMPQIAKKRTHIVWRIGLAEWSALVIICYVLVKIPRKKKVLKKKERKAILNIAIQHRDALFLACFVGVALVTGRGGST